MIKVGLVSLGCAKNLIDSEVMAGHLQRVGMALTPDAADADALIINTCSFIDQAKKESIAAIHEAVEARGGARRQRIIVAGCLAQRFRLELPALMPEVDAFIGLDQIPQIAGIISGLFNPDADVRASARNLVTVSPRYIPDYDTPRFRLTPAHYAYVKIAEGCNHHCTFCVIPKIRGKHRSRAQDSVVREARDLISGGVRELNLISQDTTYFGMDRWTGARANRRSGVDSARGESLASLLRELDTISGDFWLRLLYTHPAHWSDELIQTIADSRHVARYIDIPLQHISDRMLARMKRETSGAHIRALVKKMRERIPNLAIRTTFIVGFPGETDADFDELMNFLDEAKFERAGIFEYSREEGTRAAGLDGRVHHATRRARWNKAMARLQELYADTNRRQVGKTLRVLVGEPGVARSEWDAPGVDGGVFVNRALPAGQFADVTISGWRGYDLEAAD
ncbi:MAG: 30S ribosomal protein S12 methylthiotransferase RimO [Verrucomicrobiales bacterium]|jgi:ribosomal protein S12 methylthiotransferase|nr:30S ribosomal protein S12 methylthiotransferase RimO [Verrucomicrobiales bacterium]